MYIDFQQNPVCRSVKPCTQIYLHNIASCINLQLSIINFKNRLFQTYIIVKPTCISIFSKIGSVDRSKPCTQIYLQKNASCINFQLLIVILKNSILLDRSCIMLKRTCISIFSKIVLEDQSKPCTQIYLQKIANCINL